ncbi:alpha-hydroxy acid oxidase [Paeniglutamicibacter gangotriensis]|uniref:alpha-hydroxy acid oxidase n=1 Tax=Paeniglutamicibacter gangotriensis TaxID=254787 RepID=UPI0037C5CD3B
MKISDALELISPRLPTGTLRQRRLRACHTVKDLRTAARSLLPSAVFDYVDGGADQELSLETNTSAFERYRYLPQVLRDVGSPDTSGNFLGRPAALPLGFAPTGYTRMMHPEGEPAAARAAAEHRIPYVLSTMASTSLEDLAAAPGADAADRWFQLYVWKDRELTRGMVSRAQSNGYRVLEVAVDTAVSGKRLRDVRNGLTIPPALTLGSLLDIASRPNYWMGMLRGEKLEFANVRSDEPGGHTIEGISDQFDPTVNWEDLARIRDTWNGSLVLKGPLGPEDAMRAQALGVDGVHLSNHGGRQLDRTVAPVDLVAPVRAAVGDSFGIFVDSGVRHGSDIATAIALGADACFVGRPYLWALVAGGEEGVGHLVRMLTEEFTRTMQLLGVGSVQELRARGPELLHCHEPAVMRTDRPGQERKSPRWMSLNN